MEKKRSSRSAQDKKMTRGLGYVGIKSRKNESGEFCEGAQRKGKKRNQQSGAVVADWKALYRIHGFPISPSLLSPALVTIPRDSTTRL